jgi:WD40 repeat protein
VYAITPLPDGRSLALARHSPGQAELQVVRVDTVGRSESSSWKVPCRSNPSSVALAPGRLAPLAVTSERSLAVWQSATERYSVPVPADPPVGRLTFSPDGNTLAIRAYQGLWLWDVSGQRVRATITEGKQINGVAFAPDGATLATANEDGAVRFYRVEGGARAGAFEWGTGGVTALAFAPDGLTAAAIGSAAGVVVWDVDG